MPERERPVTVEQSPEEATDDHEPLGIASEPATSTGSLVHLPGLAPGSPPPLRDPRASDVDAWGRSERSRQVARRLFDPIYRNLFRVEWEGLEKIPAEGGALLVANHAGALPSDAPVIMHGIEEELGRPVYGLADSMFKGAPFVGTLWARMGGVVAHPDNAYRLLGTPYFPITANQLLFGPVLGLVAYLPAKFKLRVLDPVSFDLAPDQPRYSKSRIMEEAERIRQEIQTALYDMLRARTSVWRG